MVSTWFNPWKRIIHWSLGIIIPDLHRFAGAAGDARPPSSIAKRRVFWAQWGTHKCGEYAWSFSSSWFVLPSSNPQVQDLDLDENSSQQPSSKTAAIKTDHRILYYLYDYKPTRLLEAHMSSIWDIKCHYSRPPALDGWTVQKPAVEGCLSTSIRCFHA